MRRKIGLTILVVFCMSACSHNVKGFKPAPVDRRYLPRFPITNDVAVVGEFQDDPGNILFYSNVLYKWYLNENEVVKTAVTVVKDILKENNVAINEANRKVIKISFIKADYETGMWTGQVHFTFRVQAGDKFTKTYKGTQNIGITWRMRWAVEASISDAFIQVFQDPDTLAYLSH